MTCPHCDLIAAAFYEVRSELQSIKHTLEEIVSEDAAVEAVVTDEAAQIQSLGVTVSSFESVVQALQAEVASGTALQPSTLAALQAGEAALDALAQQAAADVAADSPAPSSTPSAS